jgi:hypothetical protein
MLRENDFNDTQKDWIGGETVRRDTRRINKAKEEEDTNNNEVQK